MQSQIRVTLTGVIEQADIGKDHRIGAKSGCSVNGVMPFSSTSWLGEGVDGNQDLALFGLRVANAFGDLLFIEIEAGKVAGIGVVAKADIDGVCAMVNSGLECGKAASRAHQSGNSSHGGMIRDEQEIIVSRSVCSLISVKTVQAPLAVACRRASIYCDRGESGMESNRVLVIDDEELNLLIIEEFLAEEGLQLEMESDPLVAWERLAAPDSDYSLVILDRMMPGLDGLSFLRRMKADPRLANVPVILQTAASAPEQVREGLLAGAFYYLIKPYEPEALVSIVRGALEDSRIRRALRKAVKRQAAVPQLLISAEYRFSTLQDINSLLPELVALSPNPDQTASGIADLMVNAVEHGNLGITYKEKARFKQEGGWEAEVARRLALPENQGRCAIVRVERFPDRIDYTVTDLGNGFDWQQYLDFDPERAFDPNGRGIAMARLMSFSHLEYIGCGNQVRASVKRATETAPQHLNG